MNPSNATDVETQFQVRCVSTYRGCLVLSAATAGYLIEGIKAVETRRRLGYPEPKIEGKPLSSFVNARFASGTDIEAFALILARRTGLGAWWLARNLPDAPEAALVSDQEFAAVLRQRLELLEG